MYLLKYVKKNTITTRFYLLEELTKSDETIFLILTFQQNNHKNPSLKPSFSHPG